MLTGKVKEWGLKSRFVVCTKCSSLGVFRLGKIYPIKGNAVIASGHIIEVTISEFTPALSLAKLLYGVEDV